jgi:hypothetical protein
LTLLPMGEFLPIMVIPVGLFVYELFNLIIQFFIFFLLSMNYSSYNSVTGNDYSTLHSTYYAAYLSYTLLSLVLLLFGVLTSGRLILCGWLVLFGVLFSLMFFISTL